jgi:hypothetical protein
LPQPQLFPVIKLKKRKKSFGYFSVSEEKTVVLGIFCRENSTVILEYFFKKFETFFFFFKGLIQKCFPNLYPQIKLKIVLGVFWNLENKKIQFWETMKQSVWVFFNKNKNSI